MMKCAGNVGKLKELSCFSNEQERGPLSKATNSVCGISVFRYEESMASSESFRNASTHSFGGDYWEKVVKLLILGAHVLVKILVNGILQNAQRVAFAPMKLETNFGENGV